MSSFLINQNGIFVSLFFLLFIDYVDPFMKGQYVIHCFVWILMTTWDKAHHVNNKCNNMDYDDVVNTQWVECGLEGGYY